MPILAQYSSQAGSCIAGSKFEISIEKVEIIRRQRRFTLKCLTGKQAYWNVSVLKRGMVTFIFLVRCVVLAILMFSSRESLCLMPSLNEHARSKCRDSVMYDTP